MYQCKKQETSRVRRQLLNASVVLNKHKDNAAQCGKAEAANLKADNFTDGLL